MANEIKTLYSDSAKQNALYPRTKFNAISDSEGNTLTYAFSKVAKSNTGITILKLTQAEYDALAVKDNNTLYLIV